MTVKLSKEYYRKLRKLRKEKPALQKVHIEGFTFGQKVSDVLTAVVGSWSFLILQTIVFSLWMLVNVMAWIHEWDPYPFILLNLVLSFQAAFTGPIIMMSQNRQNEIDRKRARNEYDINLKAELEIEHLQEKMDKLRQKEIKKITDLLKSIEQRLTPPAPVEIKDDSKIKTPINVNVSK